MKAKNLIKRVTIGILAVVLSTSVVWADDNPGLIQRAKDACKNATYDIQTVTNDIDGWPANECPGLPLIANHTTQDTG